MTEHAIRTRIENALWGLLVGDALAMPVHWYYDKANIRADFPNGIEGYAAARHPHPEAFMLGRPYRPDVATAVRLGRAYDILHEHARFYTTTYSRFGFARPDRDAATGNAIAASDERFHYHHGLGAGETTVAGHLARVLLRSLAEQRGYRPDAFVDAFIAHLTTPGRNRDAYLEAWIRYWFEAFASGLPAHACAASERDDWSIASHSGLIRPLVLALLAPTPQQALGLALDHHALTHRSPTNAAALALLVPLVHALSRGADPRASIIAAGRALRLPAVDGRSLLGRYRAAGGPYNIPKPEMWALHHRFHDEPLDLARLVAERDEDEVAGTLFSTACYPEHGVPLLLYLALRHDLDLERALRANAEAGGDNVHRGAVLGLLLGAAGSPVPAPLRHGLLESPAIAAEIERVLALFPIEAR